VSAGDNLGTAVPPSHLIDSQQVRDAARYAISVRTIMRISARNQIKGTVIEVKKGATTSHVRVDIGNGQIVTSSITNESVDELGIKAKSSVIVVVKASDVMIAVN
jgi:molybdopterin-binding protein